MHVMLNSGKARAQCFVMKMIGDGGSVDLRRRVGPPFQEGRERSERARAARLMIGHFCPIHHVAGLGRTVSRMRCFIVEADFVDRARLGS